MVNTRRKGNRTRNEIIKFLQSNGFDVAIVERTGRFVKEKDAFGFVDVIAVKGKEIKFIQSKTNSRERKTESLMKKFIKKNKGTGISCEIWTKFDRKGFKIKMLKYAKDNIKTKEVLLDDYSRILKRVP